MEKALQKIAQQIMAFDEASLSSLFDKYAEAAQRFEPTRRWEEAVVALGIIQTVRWKNQLFNYRWKSGTAPLGDMGEPRIPEGMHEKKPDDGKSEPGLGDGGDRRGKLLRFRPREDDEPV